MIDSSSTQPGAAVPHFLQITDMVTTKGTTYTKSMTAEPVYKYLAGAGPGKMVLHVSKGKVIFSQGEPADSVFYIQKGRIKISVRSRHGREATLGLLGEGGFVGEECIASDQPRRMGTAAAIQPCTVLKIDSKEMMHALAEDKAFGHLFQAFLLKRCVVMHADMVEQLFSSSEQRLARTLLWLAQLHDGSEASTAHTTQETLAEMIGSSRSRVDSLMNRFRKLGYLQKNGHSGGVQVHRSLFNVLLKG
jgi:CRP-like cAMP-binding protein